MRVPDGARAGDTMRIYHGVTGEVFSFNQPLNNWDVSKVLDMERMFFNASSFNQPLHAPWY